MHHFHFFLPTPPPQDRPQCRHNRTQVIYLGGRAQPQGKGTQLTCPLDTTLDDSGGMETKVHWNISFQSEQTKADRSINSNSTSSGHLLDVEQALDRWWTREGLKNGSQNVQMVVQCYGENVAGRQGTPCSFLVRFVQHGSSEFLYSGKPPC